MKEYNEQVVETLDDAGCIIANKNIIIDNLQARIAELEEDAETYAKKDQANYELRQQLAASQLHAEQLREALGQAISVFEGYSVNRKPCYDAMEQPRDTSALDAYVAESREAAYREARKAEQRVAEAIVDMLQQKHRNCFGAHSFYLAASVATANGEWRKFVKEE